jgi:hypothetical protein
MTKAFLPAISISHRDTETQRKTSKKPQMNTD